MGVAGALIRSGGLLWIANLSFADAPAVIYSEQDGDDRRGRPADCPGLASESRNDSGPWPR